MDKPKDGVDCAAGILSWRTGRRGCP